MTTRKIGRVASGLLLALAGVASSCSCGGGGERELAPQASFHDLGPDPQHEYDYRVDFGVVAIGSRETRTFRVKNVGSTALVLQGEEVAKPFESDLPLGGLNLGVAAEASIAFDFLPLEPTDAPIQTVVKMRTNEDRGAKEYTVLLVGRGATPGLDCDPGTVDFGAVVVGETKKARSVCTNRLEVPIMMQLDAFTGNGRDHFAATIVSDGAVPDEAYEVKASGTVEIEFTFSASIRGPVQAVLPLQDTNPIPTQLARIEVVASGSDSALLISPTSCLDFQYVPMGGHAEESYTLTNIGTQPVRLLAVTIPQAAAAEFSVVTELPLTVQPDGSTVPLTIRYEPQTGGQRVVNFAFRTDDPRTAGASIDGCATGFGGGPQIVCTPEAIDFGMVAVEMPVTRSMRCTNAGSAPEGQVVDPLVIDALYTDNEPIFDATIRNQDGSIGAHPEGYAIDEFFWVDVVYNPVDESFDRGLVIIETRGAIGGSLSTIVAGQGRNLPPCQFEIMSPRLEFGVVDRGDSLVQSFTITNQLKNDSCLISDLRLSDDSDEAFSITPISNVELPAESVLKVPVTFAPTRYQPNITGTVLFQISNKDNPFQQVPLRGTSAKPCVSIDPTVIDFGKVEPSCHTRERFVQISNVCGTPIEVTAVEVNDNAESGAFQIVRRPVLPRVLNPNEREEFSMIFAPDDVGPYTGTVRVEVGDEWYLAQLEGEGEYDAVQTDTFNQKDRPKVDILWVMDNSGSFGPFQQVISQNLPAFLTFANEQKIDFHIGVTTSGLTTRVMGPPWDCPGGADGGENGRLFPVDGSHPRILTPTTPNLEEHWIHNMSVGECHDAEEYYEAARRALSKPLIDEVKDSRYPGSPYNDGNAGFLRKEASLSIIVIADEPDQSTGFPNPNRPGTNMLPIDYVDFFREIKGNRNSNMFKFHAIAGARTGEPRSCFASAGDRLLVGVDETEGTWIDICTPLGSAEAWQEGLKAMSKGAFGFSARFFLRGQPGDNNGDGRVNEEDIQVFVDGFATPPISKTRARVWTFDPLSNAIDFAPLFIPKPGSQLSATYKVACLQ